MASQWLVDGIATRQLPADDRGLAYGDGVFRTLRIARGAPEAWAAHIERLVHDCQRLMLPAPDEVALADDARRLIAVHQAPASDAVLKIMITRGSGGRGYAPLRQPQARRIVSLHELPARATQANEPLTLDQSSIRLARQPVTAGVKHLNRLEQVLARAECDRLGVADTVLFDTQGWLISTTMRNLLLRDDQGCWYTPRLDQAGIIGATRQRLLAGLKATGHQTKEIEMRLSDLTHFNAAIACNSVAGVSGLARIGDTVFTDSEAAAANVRDLLELF